MVLRYMIYDVFTDTRLAGNPLAVVFGADALSDEMMQAVAGEMNLSETVFVQTAQNPAHAARLRIFTPARELPFAAIRRWGRPSPFPNSTTRISIPISISSACWRKMSGRCVAR